jgi:hypothetical protein
MNLRIFYSDGKITVLDKVANEYHAQNILSLLFVAGDGKGGNDVVFAELLGSKIFAYRCKSGVTIRNATDDFLAECKEMIANQKDKVEK